jgi:hypothetical protein
VVDNVRSAESELTIFRPHLGHLLGKLRVFHHGKGISSLGEHADRLGGKDLANDLGSYGGVAGDAAPDEHGIGDFDETVVDAVHVYVADLPVSKIFEHGVRLGPG